MRKIALTKFVLIQIISLLWLPIATSADAGCCVTGNGRTCREMDDLSACIGGGLFPDTKCEEIGGCPQYLPAEDERICCLLYREGGVLNGCIRDTLPKQCADFEKRLSNLSGEPHTFRYDVFSDCTTNRECFAILDDHRIILNTGIPGLKDIDAPFNLGKSGENDELIGGFSVYLAAIYQYIVIVAVLLSVLVVMIGGYRWISAAGSPERIKEAQKMIGNAIAGLIIALISFTVLELLNKNLVELPHLVPLRIPRIEFDNLTQGTQCRSTDECGADLACLETPGIPYPTCRKLRVGEICEVYGGVLDDSTEFCSTGLFCMKKRSGRLFSTCSPKLGVGEVCDDKEEDGDDEDACQSGICRDGRCAAR